MENLPFGRRLARAFLKLLLTVLVLGLFGSVLVLLSQLNSRTFWLEAQGGKLVVLKGRMFPSGTEPYHPADPTLAEAYAPLDLHGLAAAHLTGRRFHEREELDRALFEMLQALARPRIDSEEPKVLEEGLYYLRRADRLSGLSEEQRLSLKAMKAEVAFYQARGKLEEAQRLVTEALGLLRAAAQSKRHAKSAQQMILAVEPPATALEESLRQAIYALGTPEKAAATPSEPPAPPVPAPASPQ